ncbi:dienelactone hydrolase family protein [Marinobacter sp.]|uniref:dienelactone hydrolase family protein n=1 Tax=Marinobacter sp. TaxID=50741 RepID=UPI00384A89D5
MKITSPLALALLLAIASTPAVSELQTSTIEYTVNDSVFSGYLAYDDDFKGERPGVLVVHEWWGHNEFARSEAEKLASAGYTAFALDMYGSGKQASHPEDAQKLMQATMGDKQAMEDRFRAAMKVLQDQNTVDASRIAAQGYCFGGAVVLNMARMGLDLDGVVSFHGSLGSDISPEQGGVSPRLLVYTGGSDEFVPVDQVTGFVGEMMNAEADLTLVSFPDAKHSFMSPAADEIAEKFGMPIAYNEEAASRAWERTLRFYGEIFNR